MATPKTTVTAIPCGTKDGQPITKRYAYELTREPETFGRVRGGRERSRLWGAPKHIQVPGDDRLREAPLAIVWSDSIETA